MAKICLISAEFLGRTSCTLSIQDYILYGIILFLVGMLMASFLPLPRLKKFGIGVMILGLIMAIGFPLIINWWNNSLTFRLLGYSAVVFVIIVMILFPGTPQKLIKKKV